MKSLGMNKLIIYKGTTNNVKFHQSRWSFDMAIRVETRTGTEYLSWLGVGL